MKYIIDIETNSLISGMVDYSTYPYKLKEDANIWVISIFNLETEEITTLIKEEITRENLSKALKDATEIISHNGAKFDWPVLKLFDLWDYSIGYVGEKSYLNGREIKFIDTLIWSRILYPDRFGGHSLESWGERTGEKKIDFRQICIDKGYIDKKAPRGAEFEKFVPEMPTYCNGDVKTNATVYDKLLGEASSKTYIEPIEQELKLADLSVSRENFGFYFDNELAEWCVEDLTKKMLDIKNKIDPILPMRKLNETEKKHYTPPKIQLKLDGSFSNSIERFVNKHGGSLLEKDGDKFMIINDVEYKLPYHECLKEGIEADIDNLDHVKMYLIDLGWEPTEWRFRNLTQDSKKQNLSVPKRIAALDRWWKATIEGKYKYHRLDYFSGRENIYEQLKKDLEKNETRPILVPTSPSVKVGVEKNLCPNLEKLGESVDFAKDFGEYLTYRSRKNVIAGGLDIEDEIDFEDVNKGWLASYRKEDNRIPTPAIEIGAISNRYKHSIIVNCPRITSLYGEYMRKMLTSGPNFVFFSYDFAS